MSSFETCFQKVRENSSAEHVNREDSLALGKACRTDADVRFLVSQLVVDEEEFDDDAGDIWDYYWRLRESIVDALVVVGEQSVAHLIEVLGSDDEDAAEFAARTLGRIGSLGCKQALLGRLAIQDDSLVGVACINALAEIGSPDLTQVLLPLLSFSDGNLPEETVRAAAMALGAIGVEEAIEPLKEVLRHHPHPNARVGAVKGLVSIATSEALNALREVDDPGPKVTRAIASVLQ